MLSKIVINLYTVLLEVGLWLMLLAGLVMGWMGYGFWGALGGLIVAAIFGSLLFGGFLVINDIRDRVKVIESKNTAAN